MESVNISSARLLKERGVRYYVSCTANQLDWCDCSYWHNPGWIHGSTAGDAAILEESFYMLTWQATSLLTLWHILRGQSLLCPFLMIAVGEPRAVMPGFGTLGSQSDLEIVKLDCTRRDILRRALLGASTLRPLLKVADAATFAAGCNHSQGKFLRDHQFFWWNLEAPNLCFGSERLRIILNMTNQNHSGCTSLNDFSHTFLN